jgi:simple sugar transport system ATP-binding protein
MRILKWQAIKKIQEILNRYGWKLPLLEPIEQLPVGLQQRVEIVKLLYRDSNILILDEPTAVLTPSEAEELFSNLRELKTQGKTIILITHKLKEVMKIADKATVMRAGAVVAERDISQTSASELAELMVGRKVNLSRQVQPATFAGQPYVVAKNIFPDSDLQIYAGEIVGIAGVEGNGQKELIESLVFPGRNWSENTKVTIASQDISGWSTESLRKNGLGVLAQDRLAESLAPQFSAWENYLIGQDWRENFQHLGFLKNSQIKNNCLANFHR